ncbi:MAG TPA: MopE-related protein [Dongiaceae bacterium]|nr:MopE-related protein [Dongiaceae bacterium]
MRAYAVLLSAALCLLTGWAPESRAAEPRRAPRTEPKSTVAPTELASESPGQGATNLRPGKTLPAPSSTPRPAILPVAAALAEETCDGADNDGDGEIDEELTRPCSSACDSGTETCALGHWMSCSARPCCDDTAGPGLPTSTICPAAETADATLCLMPGTYSIPAGCRVRSSLVGLGDPADIVIDGEVTLTEAVERIQGVTITGLLKSEGPLDLLGNRLLNGFSDNNEDFFPIPPLQQVLHNEVHGLINVEFPSFIHANTITGGGVSLNIDHADFHVVTGNHIVDAPNEGVRIAPRLRAYLAGNLIEGARTGIRSPCDAAGLQIVANRIVAAQGGVDACAIGEISLLRNDISYGGEVGAHIDATRFRIEGNQIVRAPGAPASSASRGIRAEVQSDGCPACGGSLRDNTVVGGAHGIRVDHEFTGSHALLTGNIVTGHSGTGIEICARDLCPASPLYSVTALSNDVFGGAASWTGTGDPTGANGNIAADPQFVDPVAGDFRLSAGSPCIDAGSPGLLSVDLPGRPRSLDGDGDGTAVPDMGAWEAGSTCRDEDEDGFGSPGNEDCPAGSAADCDDADPAIHPGAIDLPGNPTNESCDGSPAACDPERAGGWRNHGQYVSCVARAVSLLVNGGLLPADEGELLVRTAAQSSVGK